MDRAFDESLFQASYDLTANNGTDLLDRSYDPVCEQTTNKQLDGCELQIADCEPSDDCLTDTTATEELTVWQPADPQYCKAVAEYYGVERRTVQKWFQKAKEACPWLSEADLKLPDDRYTPLCIELMGDYRVSGLSAAKWAVTIQERFQEQATPATSATQPPIPDDYLDEAQISRYAPNELDYSYFSYGLPPDAYPIAYQRPSENSLVHLLERKLHNIALFNEQERLRMEDFDRALKDTETTLQALEDMSAIEQGIAKADRHEYLMQQAYNQRRQQHQIHRSQSQGAHPAPKPDPAPVGAKG